MNGVFISYRRDDVGFIASDIADVFEDNLDASVFFDLQSIEIGTKYQLEIEQALRYCSVAVILLGKDWYGATQEGLRRIDDPKDIFRKEIETSLRSNKYVIPVLVGIDGISAASLGAIRALADLQWHRIRLGQKKDDIKRLVEKVQQALYERRQMFLAGSNDGKLHIEKYEGPIKFIKPKTQMTNDSLDPYSTQANDFLMGAYLYSEELNFRANIAILSNRPFLIVGSERQGRYGIARHIANILNWRFYTHTLTLQRNIFVDRQIKSVYASK